jgi:Ca-activated chloride channel family protein
VTDFHFLRPLWLALLLLLPLLYLARHRLEQRDIGWEKHIPARLLRPLIPKHKGPSARSSRSPLLPLGAAMTVLAIALAGPSWREAPTPLKQSQDSLVMVLDLSISMLATDVEPDRITQARRKLRDILAERQGALNALVVYAGDAHVVTPLTEDTRTIEALLDVLEPIIMPAQGNRADLAIEQAIGLLDQGAPGRGQILLLTDQVSENYRNRITERLNQTNYSLSTLVVGTEEGGPMPLAKRGFIRDGGKIVIAKADPGNLNSLADRNGGSSHALTLGNADIRALELQPDAGGEWSDTKEGLKANRWQDDGYWLLWLALPLLLLGWRRGAFAVVALALLPMTLAPRHAMAVEWTGLWQREDQRAPQLIEQDPKAAAQQLQQPGWKGSALYRIGQYDAAAEAFSSQPGATGHYNRGNALARAGQLEQAIDAYDQALQENPDMDAARFNKQLVEQLQEQEEQQQQQQQQQQQESDQGSNEQHQQQDSQQQSPPENPNDEGQPDQDAQQETSEGQEPESQDKGEPSQPEPQSPPSGQSLDQGQEQWLRRIPDNPGGLLQRKFLQQHQQRQTGTDEGDTPW